MFIDHIDNCPTKKNYNLIYDQLDEDQKKDLLNFMKSCSEYAHIAYGKSKFGITLLKYHKAIPFGDKFFEYGIVKKLGDRPEGFADYTSCNCNQLKEEYR